MAHPFLFVRGEIRTIKDFADMEIPVMIPNQSGIFVDAVCVGIPVPKGYGAVVEIARDSEDRYYASCYYATPTGGGGFTPSAKWNTLHGKEEAFLEGIKLLGRCDSMRKFQREFRDAKHEYFKRSHKQLTLF